MTMIVRGMRWAVKMRRGAVRQGMPDDVLAASWPPQFLLSAAGPQKKKGQIVQVRAGEKE